MYYELHCEGFQMTESIRNYARDQIQDLDKTVPEKLSLRVYCKLEAPQVFSVTFNAHIWKKDFVIKETGADFYALLHDGRKALEAQVHRLKEKRQTIMRRKSPGPQVLRLAR